jgi:multicomponent K+:H+ antiporter subunit D
MWPLNFWLVPAYSAAAAPVGALFAIMTKVGVYATLRLWTLWFSPDAGTSAQFGGDWLVISGLATMAFGAIGLLASHKLERLASFSVIVSSGTLLASIGFGQAALTGGALFYLLGSTLATSALFLMVELTERARQVEIDAPPPDEGGDPLPFTAEPIVPPRSDSPDDEGTLIGQTIPASMVFLGLAFIGCTLMLTGMPPLAGFLAKLSMLSALLSPIDTNVTLAAQRAAAGWVLLGALIVTGFISMLALSRAGIRIFWAPQARPSPRLRIIECLPIAALLLACAMLTVRAEPALRYARSAADALHRPEQYIRMVLSVRPVPNPPAKGAVE